MSLPDPELRPQYVSAQPSATTSNTQRSSDSRSRCRASPNQYVFNSQALPEANRLSLSRFTLMALNSDFDVESEPSRKLENSWVLADEKVAVDHSTADSPSRRRLLDRHAALRLFFRMNWRRTGACRPSLTSVVAVLASNPAARRGISRWKGAPADRPHGKRHEPTKASAAPDQDDTTGEGLQDQCPRLHTQISRPFKPLKSASHDAISGRQKQTEASSIVAAQLIRPEQ